MPAVTLLENAVTRFFFDVTNGERDEPDLDGLVFAQVSDARRAAVEGMADIVRESLRAGSRKKIAMNVRTEAGKQVLSCVVLMDVTPL